MEKEKVTRKKGVNWERRYCHRGKFKGLYEKGDERKGKKKKAPDCIVRLL